MKRSFFFPLLTATVCFTATLPAQGGYGRGGLSQAGRYDPRAPKLPTVELAGPLDTALAPRMLKLSPDQGARYAQVYDSFMVATRPQRDSATALLAKMNARLEDGDRAAAMFYAEQVQDLGKSLGDRQDHFENELRRFLNGDQIKAYKKWKEGEEQAAERKQ